MRSSRVVDEILPSVDEILPNVDEIFPSYGWDLAECGWDLAVWMRSCRVWMRSCRVWMRSSRECLERLTANAKVATDYGFDPSILRHRRIWGVADEAVFLKYIKKFQSIESRFRRGQHYLRKIEFQILRLKQSWKDGFYEVTSLPFFIFSR